MSKIAVVYWSGTGNTEAMANEVAEGKLGGKKIALFGSYGWGDGEWMRTWEETCKADGAVLACDSVLANEAPDDDAVAACQALGKALC